jgi:OmcA/MtrC family decaheme c-type cytochrome
MHNGFDKRISDENGVRYADANTVVIDDIVLNGNMLTVDFSAANTAIVPELLVSFYGWDTKHFIVASHTRDGSDVCNGRGCRMEYVPESSGGGANALFVEDPASVPGDWRVTLDMAAYVATSTDDIPTLIANGDVKTVEVIVTPELMVDNVDVGLDAVSQTFDLGGSVMVDDYFKGDNAAVDVEKCNVCHDQLAVTFHGGSGRGGDIVACKTCHVTTSGGSHLEMQSRSIDSYAHAVHTFQPFDLDDIVNANDPVITARYEQHITHTFPNFTIRNCEACHVDGAYNVPDQTQSMPGLQSASYDIADRNIGMVPESVTGPASRACGGCHRADMINADLAGDLASFNAHTDSFGNFIENDEDDLILYGIIDKIMSMFK